MGKRQQARAAATARRVRDMTIDYHTRTEMPIRDMYRDGAIVFVVTIYGWTGRDVCVIPGGSAPMHKAVARLGLDPDRYQAMMWDALVVDQATPR
jgi:hypothetical protein